MLTVTHATPDSEPGTPPLRAQPRGLWVLAALELWERFSYYGMRALLVLYLVNGLGWSIPRAAGLYGTYTASAYVLSLLGGWVADRWLGAVRTLYVGGVLIVCGHLLLTIPREHAFLTGLSFVALGTGLFKPTVSALVGALYSATDSRRDSGYTLYYMGINLGAFLAPVVCGYLGERVGWHWGFGAAALGMLLGLWVLLLGRKHLPETTGRVDPAVSRPRDSRITEPQERAKLVALAVVAAFVVAFWVGAEQQGSSLNLLADRSMDRHVFGFLVPTSWFQTVPSGFILLFAPIVASGWQRMALRDNEPSAVQKMIVGLGLLAVGFWLLANRIAAAAPLPLHPIWLLAMYALLTAGELCLSPVGLAFVSRLAPARLGAVMMALWFAAIALGNKLAGMVAAFYTADSATYFFALVGLVPAVAALGLYLLQSSIERWTQGRT